MFSVCDHYPTMPRTGNALLEELLQEIVLAEELGYYGYLVAEHHFHEYGLVSNPAPFLCAAAQRTDRIRLGPGISVLPFRNLIGDPEQSYFTDGLCEDLVTALAGWRCFPIIASSSVVAYKGRSAHSPRIANDLGACYFGRFPSPVWIQNTDQRATDRVRHGLYALDGSL